MRVTILAGDGFIVVDSRGGTTDCAELLAQGISAVQWYDDTGEIEFVGHSQPNEAITDFAPFQKYVDNAVWPAEPKPIEQPAETGPIVFTAPSPTPIEQWMFDCQNRVLALEGKPPISLEEFLASWVAMNEAYAAAMNAAFEAAKKAQRG
jgi:hypothetical protein